MWGIDKLKNWLTQQNAEHKFARAIKDGRTVYFSDTLAACYDIMIAGLENDVNSIVIQFEDPHIAGADFLESASHVWVHVANWELWYLDNDLQWIIVIDKNGQKKYNRGDLIRSERINFEFKLEQVI